MVGVMLGLWYIIIGYKIGPTKGTRTLVICIRVITIKIAKTQLTSSNYFADNNILLCQPTALLIISWDLSTPTESYNECQVSMSEIITISATPT